MRTQYSEEVVPQVERREGVTSPRHAAIAGCLRRARRAAQTACGTIDTDADLALRAFRRQVWLVCGSAPVHIFRQGETANELYLRALRARGDHSEPAWSDLVRAVRRLIAELDCYPSQASHEWRDARGALSRIVIENVDLLESTARSEKHDRAS